MTGVSEKEVKISFHGHSRHSDGLDPVEDLVVEAARQGITYFGISDHNTVNGVAELYRTISRVNQSGRHIFVPVSAIEIMTTQGDLVVARPGEMDSSFLRWAKDKGENARRVFLTQTIKEAVEGFDAIAVIPHPGAPFMEAVSLSELVSLRERLDKNVLLNVGVEVKNWSTRIMVGLNPLRELVVCRIADTLGLAKFGLSDFHSHWQIGKQFTLVKTNDLTADGLLNATKNRQVYPGRGDNLTPRLWMKLFLTFAQSHTNS